MTKRKAAKRKAERRREKRIAALARNELATATRLAAKFGMDTALDIVEASRGNETTVGIAAALNIMSRREKEAPCNSGIA